MDFARWVLEGQLLGIAFIVNRDYYSVNVCDGTLAFWTSASFGESATGH